MERIGGRVMHGVQGTAVVAALATALVTLPFGGAGAAARSSVPSVSCNFSEPFISYAVSSEGVLDTAVEQPTPALRKIISSKGSTNSRYEVVFNSGTTKVSLVVTKETGDDGMSDITTTHRGRRNGIQAGACSVLPTGYVARRVKGVVAGDKLNVRVSPKSSAAVVGGLSNNTAVWIQKSSGKWLRAAFVSKPVDGVGMARVKTGWVSASFVTKSAA